MVVFPKLGLTNRWRRLDYTSLVELVLTIVGVRKSAALLIEAVHELHARKGRVVVGAHKLCV